MSQIGRGHGGTLVGLGWWVPLEAVALHFLLNRVMSNEHVELAAHVKATVFAGYLYPTTSVM